jgi:hypothetical protein
MEKKALSEIVSNIAIILLTMALVAALSPFIINFVKHGLNDSSACLGLEESVKYDDSFGYNCIDKNNSQIKVTLRTISDNSTYSRIKKVEINLVKANGEAKVLIVPSSNVTMLSSSGTISSSIPPIGNARTYIITDSTAYVLTEVYPIIDNNKLCTKTDTRSLEAC